MSPAFDRISRGAHAGIAVVMAGTLLAGCGGGEDATTAPEAAVTGAVTKGPVAGASVSLFEFDGAGAAIGPALARATTDGGGNFSVPVFTPPAAATAVLVQACGGQYVDESDPESNPALKRRIGLAATDCLEGALIVGSTTVAVTPYAMALLQKARDQFQTQAVTRYTFATIFAAIRFQATQAFGFDPFTLIPANPVTGTGGAQNYALALGGAAQAINAIAVNAGHLPTFTDVLKFINDFSDGRLDGACPAGRTPCPAGGVDLNAEIRRFRSNNFGAYQFVPPPAINETSLSRTAPVANEQPTLDPLGPLTISQNAGVQTVNLTGISGGPSEATAQTLTVTAASGNTTLIPTPTVSYTSPSATGTLSFTPAPGLSGTATITVTVRDSGGSANGGIDTISRSFMVTVSPGPVPFQRDFLMPYGVETATCCNNFSSATGVNAADFTQTLPLTASAFDSGFIAVRFDVNSGIISNQRPFAFVYHQGGVWMRVLLGLADSHTPVQISSENTPTICETHSDFTDINNPLAGFLLYSLPGMDNNCSTAADNVFRLIHLNDASSVVPMTVGIAQHIQNAPFFNSFGQLVRVLAVSGTNLVALDANFQNPTTLLTGVTTVESLEFTGVRAAMLAVDNTLRRASLNPNNSISLSAPLFTLNTGESFNTNLGCTNCGDNIRSESDGTNVYFTVATGTFPSITSTRLLRVPKDGSTNAVEMFSFAGQMDLDTLTDNKVIVHISGDKSLRAIPKTATAPGSSVSLDVAGPGNSFFNNVRGVGTRIFYTIQTCCSNTDTITAKIKNEDGADASPPLPGSKFVGESESFTFNLATDTLTESTTHFLLAQGATSFGTTRLQGAALNSYKVADGRTVNLTTIAENTDIFLGGGEEGPVSLGAFHVSTGPTSSQRDVFAVDLEQARFMRITTTPALNEQPIGR